MTSLLESALWFFCCGMGCGKKTLAVVCLVLSDLLFCDAILRMIR